MRHAIGLGMALALLGLSACPGDDGSLETGSMMMTTTGPMGSSSTTEPVDLTTGGFMTSDASTGLASSTGADESSSGGGSDGSSSGGGPVCDPPVVGEWNACIDDQGDIDNTLCNWIGDPDGTGFLTCLSSPPMKLDGGNVCTIRDCIDTCDCFDPPTTGTAVVICAKILADGSTACGLDCSDGQTCPDGMECASGLCFWPPA